MAFVPAFVAATNAVTDFRSDGDSDYGTDIDEDAVTDLLSQAESQTLDGLVLISIESDPVIEHASTRLLATEQLVQQGIFATVSLSAPKTRSASLQIEHSKGNQTTSSAAEEITLSEEPKEQSPSPEEDTRSPLERFRTSPKKPLSVTDIVSPAWCEQQYLFSLSKYGRVRRTPAMKQGSSVHKTLEEQVHTSVPVEVQSREDLFGLRLWNVIQGLRSLRATGLTRELAVWGVVDGQVINGIIDEISTKCPDEDMEARILGKQEPGRSSKAKLSELLETNQTTLEAFLKGSQQGVSTLESSIAWSSGSKLGDSMKPTFYICDVKTRQSRTLPPADARLRPTQMQLMLYHRLISELASASVPSDVIFKRYRLDGSATFSDVFIAEIDRLDYTLYLDDTKISSSQDSVAELLEHNTLSSLWTHMMEEYSKTMPHFGSLSPLVSAEFRAASNGAILGRRSFTVDSDVLDHYLKDEMSWWRGERPTKGVDIEEAFKCRICEFADDCSWRKDKMKEATRKARSRREAAQKTGNG